MLAPNLLDVETDLGSFGWAIAGLDAMACSLELAALTQPTPPLGWIDAAQQAYRQGRVAAQAWLDTRVEVVSQLIGTVASYYDIFSACAESAGSDDTGTEWAERLAELKSQASANDDACRDIQTAMQRAREDFLAVHRQLRHVMEQARAGRDVIGDDIQNVQVQLQALRDLLGSFGVDSATAAQSSGRSVTTSTVNVVYTVLVAGDEAVPYAAVATSLFAIGQLSWEVLVDDPKVAGTLHEIAALMNRLDHDERVWALTNHLLDQLDVLGDMFERANANAPRLNEYWKAQCNELSTLLDALSVGTPPSGLTDLSAFAVASSSWRTIARVAAESFPSAVIAASTLRCQIIS